MTSTHKSWLYLNVNVHLSIKYGSIAWHSHQEKWKCLGDEIYLKGLCHAMRTMSWTSWFLFVIPSTKYIHLSQHIVRYVATPASSVKSKCLFFSAAAWDIGMMSLGQWWYRVCNEQCYSSVWQRTAVKLVYYVCLQHTKRRCSCCCFLSLDYH